MRQHNAKSLILDHTLISHKISRMAYEIFENNFQEKTIFLAGINDQGCAIATSLAHFIKKISPIQVTIVQVSLNKSSPQTSDVYLLPDLAIGKKCVILVDDVLNSGRTLSYAMVPFLLKKVKKIEVAVLINRRHTTYPIQPTYTGYELATTLFDHIQVKWEKEAAAYLV